MNERPLDRPATDAPVDDALIGGLVRELADEWTMPPQRLDAPTWRDRVGAPTWRDRVGARGGARGHRAAWPRRMAGAAATAVVATIALSLVAVWLTVPRANEPIAGSGAGPTMGGGATPGSVATPRPTPRPTASPFPRLTVYGAPLPQTRLLIGTGPDYRVLDMGSGQLGEAVAASDIAANEIVFHDGRGLCLCGSYSVVNGADHLAIEIRTIGADGSMERVQPVGGYDGWAAQPGTRNALPGAYVHATLAPDGNTFVVGWTVRELSAWRSGIDLVDIATGRLTRAATLPDLPLLADGSIGRPGQTPSASGAAVYPFAPSIAMSPDGLRLMATQYVSISEDIAAVYRFSGELDVDGGPIRVARAASGPGTLDAADCFSFPDERFASNDVYAGLCSTDGSVVLRRVAPDGHPLGDTDLAALLVGGFGFFGNASVVDSSAAVAYYWNAFNRTLVKVHLPSGRILAQATLPDPTAFAQPSGPLAAAVRALASWLAPTALAKVYLDPALALSPDGSRLYLLGTDATNPTDVSAGSSGIWVVDSATLGVVDRWQPTADFVSLAVSRDGAFVYAAGLPGVGADGNDAPDGASVTVFDAADGSVRALAGQLGRDWLWIRGVLAP